MSTFHGQIEEIPGISVDNFEKCESRAYFLSHCHFDHTYGLYEDDFLNYLWKKKYYVYTSAHTALILTHRKPSLKGRIKPLRLGLEIILIPGDQERAIDDKYITVTVIPAGHCFGSIMFLFQTTDKTVLFTGDFRIFEDDVHKLTHLHAKDGCPLSLDTLYVDTEFQHIEYEDFPRRSESVAYAVEEIRKWLRKSDRRRIALHVSAEFGYEYIFNQIFEELGMKVYVGETAWQFYSQVQELVPGVTNDPNTKIHLCSNRSENDSHDDCIQKSIEGNKTKEGSKTEQVGNKTEQVGNKTGQVGSKTEQVGSKTEQVGSKTEQVGSKTEQVGSKTEQVGSKTEQVGSKTEEGTKNTPQKKAYLYMHFSAMKWKNYVENDRVFSIDFPNKRIDVCYATHCSRNELIYFVNYFNTKRVVGFRDPYVGPVNSMVCY